MGFLFLNISDRNINAQAVEEYLCNKIHDMREQVHMGNYCNMTTLSTTLNLLIAAFLNCHDPQNNVLAGVRSALFLVQCQFRKDNPGDFEDMVLAIPIPDEEDVKRCQNSLMNEGEEGATCCLYDPHVGFMERTLRMYWRDGTKTLGGIVIYPDRYIAGDMPYLTRLEELEKKLNLENTDISMDKRVKRIIRAFILHEVCDKGKVYNYIRVMRWLKKVRERLVNASVS